MAQNNWVSLFQTNMGRMVMFYSTKVLAVDTRHAGVFMTALIMVFLCKCGCTSWALAHLPF